ncbi:Scr1 family TA system antitoxin-like transcriptional regulator [Streptomyces sp. NPDC006864]|uniref:Scr1 family TA system antitoxin-like transcriptional regulator n=1 Tax=Streptomyces sp. NPDC006864 TaxID=3154780 RepID=UPI0034542D85
MASPRGGPSPTRDLQSVLAQSIPGLLQAPDCIRAVGVAARQWQTADEIEKFVQDRLARQERLWGDTPPELWAVASEASLLQQVCGAQVMNDQLQHLPSRAERPDVTAQAAVLARGSYEYVRPERRTGLSGGGVAPADAPPVGWM